MNYYEHLETLGKKYDLEPMTLGIIYALHTIAEDRSLISFEYWIKAYIQHREISLGKEYFMYLVKDARRITDEESTMLEDIWNFCDREQKEIYSQGIQDALFSQGYLLAVRTIQYRIKQKCTELSEFVTHTNVY